ncbi:hypothetical protein ETB97_008635 [Aspergillus alliaceus]|uniref:Rhamnogalacturonan lyase domain-containing protein n=1 Tax=Petromyces alliaceus TaxID=209559 RepID=A0A8H6ADW5_PETAA|nr:hypothetical protein ETB97_008635 [Aspergillus burnettii]
MHGILKIAPRSSKLVPLTSSRVASNACTEYYHSLSDDSPADLEYDVSSSDTAEWFHVQTAEGSWQAKFGLSDAPKSDAVAVLSTSLAGYSSGVNIRIITQGGNITIGELSGLTNV